MDEIKDKISKDDLAAKFIEIIGNACLEFFYMMGLNDGISVTVINDVNDDIF